MKFGNCSVKYTAASFLTDVLMRCAATVWVRGTEGWTLAKICAHVANAECVPK